MAKRSRSRSRGKRNVKRRFRRALKKRSRRMPSLDKHVFSRYGLALTQTVNNLSAVALDATYQLADLINYTEFTAMFDCYKILKVVTKVQMISNPDSYAVTNTIAGPSSINFYPKLWYIRDYDSGAAETLSTIKERQGAKFFVMRPNKAYSIVLRPMCSVQTYKTTVSSGYAPKRLWIDIADPTVPHYGLKTVVDTLGIDPLEDSGFKFRWETKYYVAFKGVR